MEPSLSDKVYQDLRWELTVGDLRPGDKISIRTLAQKLGVSMMPVREALKRLASERVLDSSAKKSFRVPSLNPKQIAELLFLRSSLEGIATELAAPRLTSRQLHRLDELSAEWDARITAADVRGMLVANYSFHFLIYTAAANTELVALIEGLWARTGPFVAEGIRTSEISFEWQNTHGRIVDALQARDSTLARRMVEEDIGWGVHLYRQRIEAIDTHAQVAR